MSNTKMPGGRDTLPKTGRVTEVCQEWMLREDSALAYRLQNQEFDEHLTGNKHRNALVREDFPKAKDEQLREQLLAEQAAAIYQKMLAEQEEIDKQVAKELAEKLEKEELMKKRMVELRDKDIARQILDKERVKVERHQQQSPAFPSHRPSPLPSQSSPHRPNGANYHANLPRRSALPMPLPGENHTRHPRHQSDAIELYNEPYDASNHLSDRLDRIELGLPLNEKQLQEERDAQLARQLQEQEGSLEDTLLNRDRMLAIEAQDKELAKLLQERERAKAKRARERAKQRALAKKQQQNLMETQQVERGCDQLMPDDSYAFPADVLPAHHVSGVPRNVAACPDVYAVPNAEEEEEDVSYILPADVLGKKSNYSPSKFDNNAVEKTPTAIRPTHLDLKAPLNRINKPRYPDPETCDANSQSNTSPVHHLNVAMAIDPTYSRRGGHHRPSSSYDTSSSTVTTSTSSSSPGMALPPPEMGEHEDESPAPPYMPIQGQRRTASLEKKKKKSKDGGCKQQ